MDPITSVGTGLAVLGSKEILTKLLGPTADYLGNEIKGLVEKCNFNLDRIFRIAERKLGNGIDTPGIVNPRVLKNVIDEGRFCEDELMAEYIAGVLACSRTHNGEDDRGVNLLALLKRLSKLQVRSHYIFYSTFKSVFDNEPYQWNTANPRGIWMSYNSYFLAMELDDKEVLNPEPMINHCLHGLLHEGIVRGCHTRINQNINGESKPSLIFFPSIRGVELYTWVHGFQDVTLKEFNKIPFDSLVPSMKLPEETSPFNGQLNAWTIS